MLMDEDEHLVDAKDVYVRLGIMLKQAIGNRTSRNQATRCKVYFTSAHSAAEKHLSRIDYVSQYKSNR